MRGLGREPEGVTAFSYQLHRELHRQQSCQNQVSIIQIRIVLQALGVIQSNSISVVDAEQLAAMNRSHNLQPPLLQLRF